MYRWERQFKHGDRNVDHHQRTIQTVLHVDLFFDDLTRIRIAPVKQKIN